MKKLDRFKILMLFLGFLYSFIPFEASSSDIALKIHLITLSILTIYIYSISGLKKNVFASIIFFSLLIFALFSAFISVSLYLFVFLAAITSGYIVANAIQYSPRLNRLFVSAWKWLLTFSIGMLFLQMGIYLLTGNILKLHELIFPFSHARIEVNEVYGLFRFGGAYIEPGTYSNLMYIFLIIYMFISKNTNSLLLFVGAISIILTMSVWGMVFGSYLLVILTLAKMKKITRKKLFFAVPILTIIILFGIQSIQQSSALEFAQAKLELNSGSGASKVEIINRFKDNFTDYLIIGEGFNPQIAKGIIAPQDAGFLLNLSIVFGIFFVLLVLMLYLFNLWRYDNKVLLLAFLPILISKIYYWDFSFWLLFFIIIYSYSSIKQQKVKHHKDIRVKLL